MRESVIFCKGLGLNKLSRLWPASIMAMASAWRVTANVLLYDFESDAAGWENEAPVPVPHRIVNNRAHYGQSSLGFVYHFSPTNRILTARVKEGFPRDFSDPEFLGLSAWV